MPKSIAMLCGRNSRSCNFALFHGGAEVAGTLSDIDVMIMFGIEIDATICSPARRELKWIQSLATGVDHFLRCPSLKPEVLITSGRGIHGAPMRETVVYMMMAVSRDAKAPGRGHEAASGSGGCGARSRQDRGDRRHRRCRHRDRRTAQGVRHARRRRHPHAARRSTASTRWCRRIACPTPRAAPTT